MSTRTSVITDWGVRDEDLPDVPPGEEHECLSRPQRFIVLCRIVVRGMTLVRLRIGTVEVPFELESTNDAVRRYKPKPKDLDGLKNQLRATGAAVATHDSIAITPGLEIRALLRNEGTVPIKPRAALLVQEEVM